MASGVVEAIYKLLYFIFFVDEKTQGKHMECCLDQIVATL